MTITIYTDGSCLGNPGPGAWAFIATDGKNIAKRSGGEKLTTNNQMEMMAIIRALRAAKNHKEINLWTDSMYVKNGMEKWIFGWQKNGWKTADKKPVKNKELWLALLDATKDKKINWNWVRGHNGEEMNEMVDALARETAEGLR